MTDQNSPAPDRSGGGALAPALVEKHRQDSLRGDGRNPGRAIPDVPLAQHVNHTPFWSQYYQSVDMHGRVFHTVVTRVSYDMRSTGQNGGVVAYAAEQSELAMGDVFADPSNPQGSDPLWESDFCPYKPQCDVLVVNAATRPPMSEWQRAVTRHQTPDLVPSAKRWSCGLGLRWKSEESDHKATKHQWSKQISVTGERKFGLLGIGEPQECAQVRIGWAKAYGGPKDERNPLGTGRSQGGQDRVVQQEVPGKPFRGGLTQLNYPPVSLGAVGKAWFPRRKLAGTYDNAWLKDQWPLPPKDFDYGYWNCAPTDQQVPYLPPGTEIMLANLYAPVPDGEPIPPGNLQTETWRGTLPMHQLFIRLVGVSRTPKGKAAMVKRDHDMDLDTLIVDMQRQRIVAVYRQCVGQFDLSDVDLKMIETCMNPVGKPDEAVPPKEFGPLG